MTEGWVDYLTGPWGFAFAFAAGLLSFLSPCVLPLVPAYLAHLTGTAATTDGRASNRGETLSHAIVFVLGFTAVFSFIGASVGLLGAVFSDDDAFFVRDNIRILERIAGVFLVIMGLNLVGVIRIPWLYRTYSFDAMSTTPPVVLATAGGGTATSVGAGGFDGVNHIKSFGVGAAFAVGWTPCIGPVLGAILTLSAQTSDVAQGGYLLLVYSLGLGVPFILTGLAVVPVMSFLRRYRNLLPLVEITMGVLVIAVGVLIFLDELTVFNTYFDFFGLSEI